jgi:hypothetical protein
MAFWDDIANWFNPPQAANTAFWDDIANWFNPPQAANTAASTQVAPYNYNAQLLQPVPTQNLQVQNRTGLRQSGGMPALTGGMSPAGGVTPTSPTSTNNPYGMTDQQMQDYLLGNKPISPYEQAQLDWEKYKYSNPQAETVSPYQQQQLQYQQQQAQQTLAYQQQQLAAEQAWRQQQLEADKQQRLATLAAQPKSWLEYASLAGQAPAVQPWMLPLMPQDYQQTQSVGNPIAGWTPENMKGMPDLINPSAQYMARMGPTAQQQYYGYQQADQGATPEETQWRLWSQAPPGGANRGLNQQR